NIKSDVTLDFIQLDLWKNRLIRNPERIVALVIKTARRDAAKIADAWQRCFDEALEEFVHALPAEGYLRTNGLAFAQLKVGNAFLGQCFHRALTRYKRKLGFRFLQLLFHIRLRANGSVNDHFFHLGNLMNVLITVQ